MLAGAAGLEVEGILKELPEDLARLAAEIPVTLERAPARDLVEDGIEVDTLGLFVGPSHPEGEVVGAELPAQIILYLENLWAYAGGDPRIYRREVRRTLLHELGHFLGLGEEGLALRNLD
jgi:predicted Zn-dependent protease with MMP-like domain